MEEIYKKEERIIVENWNESTPSHRVELIHSIIMSGQDLPEKYKSLSFIDMKFDDLPSGFKRWLIDFFSKEED